MGFNATIVLFAIIISPLRGFGFVPLDEEFIIKLFRRCTISRVRFSAEKNHDVETQCLASATKHYSEMSKSM